MLCQMICFLQAEDGIRDADVTGVQTCALPILCAELFDVMAGVKMTHVPYKGSGGALADVLAGRVPVYYMNLVLALPYLKDQRLRALCVTTRERSAITPELPTLDEAGLPDYQMTTSYGLCVQSATPRGMIAQRR